MAISSDELNKLFTKKHNDDNKNYLITQDTKGKTIATPLPEEDKALLQGMANDMGMKIGTYIRHIIYQNMHNYILNLKPQNKRQKDLKDAGMKRFKDEFNL